MRTHTQVSLRVNGLDHELTVDNRSTLLDVVRERLDLTGTKKGCDHGQCGACTVIVDERRVNSCLTLAVSVSGGSVTTVEGLAGPDELSALQRAFVDCDALQCGYCTPGQLCSATAMLSEIAHGWPSAVTTDTSGTADVLASLDDAEIRERMSGNLCRCGTYLNIVAAIRQASR